MADNEKQDPGKKPMDDWFVGNDDVVQKPDPKPTQKPAAPVPPPLPNGKPPGKGPLVLALVALALLGSGGYYFYRLRSRPVKVEEVTIEMPKQPEAAPPVAPVPPPTAEPKPTAVHPSKSPAKRPVVKKAEEPVQPPRPKEEPAAPPKVATEPPPKPAPPPVASSGIMLWSGKVEKNGTIVIDAGKSETGTVNGAVLPGVPVKIRVEPKGFTVAEPPSAATGWKRMAIHSPKKAHIVVTVYWDVKPN